MNIGDTLRTAAERQAAPIGAVIEHNSTGRVWTKEGEALWTCPNRISRDDIEGTGWASDTSGDGYQVVQWPAAHLQVGGVIYSEPELHALPSGTVVHQADDPENADYHWTKQEDGRWLKNDGALRLPVINTSGFFAVRSLPGTTPDATVAAVAADPTAVVNYEALLAMPVGSVFHRTDAPSLVWEVLTAHRAVRCAYTPRMVVDLSLFEGPANGGMLITSAPAHLPLGATVNTLAEFEALPVGATIRSGTGIVRVKRVDGQWQVLGSATRVRPSARMRMGFHVVDSIPTPEVAEVVEPEVVLPALGEGVQTFEQMVALPVGTVVQAGSHYRTKGEDREWHQHRDRDGVPHVAGSPDDSMSVNGYNTVVFLPSDEETVTDPRVGTVVRTRAELDDLPVGTVITWNTAQAHSRTKIDSGAWVRDGLARFARNLSMSPPWTVTSVPGSEMVEPAEPVAFTIGDLITTAEQYAALPVHSVVRHGMGSEQPVVKMAEGEWGSPINGTSVFSDASVANTSRTLVALPQGSVAPAAACTLDHSVVVPAAVAEAVAERNEDFLRVLREYWDGVNFSESEINDVLSDLGLPDITTRESITVTVSVQGRSTLDRNDVEAMVEGGYSASLDDAPVVDWTIDGIGFETEVDEGDCGCDNVDNYMVSERLSRESVSFDSFEFTTDCPNH